MDIMIGIAAASKALDLVQALRQLDKAVDSAELRFKVADLYQSLADIKMALSDAKRELQDKDEEIERLKGAFQRKADVIEYNGYPYEKGADGKPHGRPLCLRCLEVDGRTIRTVLKRNHPYISDIDVECPQCKTEYHRVSSL